MEYGFNQARLRLAHEVHDALLSVQYIAWRCYGVLTNLYKELTIK
jgi:hypothetical protein